MNYYSKIRVIFLGSSVFLGLVQDGCWALQMNNWRGAFNHKPELCSFLYDNVKDFHSQLLNLRTSRELKASTSDLNSKNDEQQNKPCSIEEISIFENVLAEVRLLRCSHHNIII